MSARPTPLAPLTRTTEGQDANVRVQRAPLHSAGPSPEVLQSIADGCADTIITADVAGRVTWVSPSAERTFGFRPDELVGWPVAELLAGGRDEARAIRRHLDREGGLRNYVTTFPGRGGRRVPVSASISVLRDAAGTATGTIVILTDITASLHFDLLSNTIAAQTG